MVLATMAPNGIKRTGINVSIMKASGNVSIGVARGNFTADTGGVRESQTGRA